MEKSPAKWTLPIRVRRAQLQKKQEDVAFESEIAQSHYSDIESGKRNPLTLSSKSFLKLAKSLEWETDQLAKIIETGHVAEAKKVTLETKVIGFDMPFWSLVGFMIKAAIALIPAAIILAILYFFISVFAWGFLVAFFGGR